MLYESVIKQEVRKSLGEYYTPDWLANRVVAEVITDPLHQRVLDPSCGSGTFVFFAVRRFLDAADEAGVPLSEAMAKVSSQVMGIDLHPVAVALARVTYLLALGRTRLTSPDRGTLSVPIYLGDSLGWYQADDILSVDMLVIPTEAGDQLLSAPLRFPDHLLQNAGRFDDLVEALVDESGRAANTSTSGLSAGTVRRLALDKADLPVLNENFVRLRDLHENKRNHIWSYYVRNVSRPSWLSRPENRVDVLVGNPPWLSYRHMSTAMQREFRRMARDRNFWHRDNTASHQDLAGVFVARAVERYLRPGGRLAFVVPNSVIDRDYWGGFRRGEFDGAHVQFGVPWDMRRVRPHMFPRGSAVIFGIRSNTHREMPARAVVWTGKVPRRQLASDTVSGLTQELKPLHIGSDTDERSPYHSRFAQGATLVPRLLCRVEEVPGGTLGTPAGMASVRSARSATEKKPWATLSAVAGTVERQFLYPTLLGEHVVPFRVGAPDTFLIPLTGKGELVNGSDPAIDGYPGLAAWVRTAEKLWDRHAAGNMTWEERLNFVRGLTQQVPVSTLRVVYAKAGMHVAAAVVEDQRAIIDHKLYWTAVSSRAEGNYLVGILNSPCLTELVRPMMSYGKDERDIDKAVWKLPIPKFDPDDELHLAIASLAAALTESLVGRVWKSPYFVTIRQEIRAWLLSNDKGRELDNRVRELLGEPPLDDEARGSMPDKVPVGMIRVTSGSLALDPSDVEIDLDIEFDADHRVYLWGFLVTGPDATSTYRHVGSGKAEFDPDELAHSLLTELTNVLASAGAVGQSVRLYHYGSVEPLFLAKLLGEDAAGLLDLANDLLQTLRDHFFCGAGYSLKQVAPIAGFTWHDHGMTGADTYELIELARKGDGSAWETLLRYNEDDTRATKALRDWLRESGEQPQRTQ